MVWFYVQRFQIRNHSYLLFSLLYSRGDLILPGRLDFLVGLPCSLLACGHLIELPSLLVQLLLHLGHLVDGALHVVLFENLLFRQRLVRDGTPAHALNPVKDRTVLEQVTVDCGCWLFDHLASDWARESFDFEVASKLSFLGRLFWWSLLALLLPSDDDSISVLCLLFFGL